MQSKIIAISNDHGGCELAATLKQYLDDNGFKTLYLGVSSGSVDYPDQALMLAEAILEGKAEKGILICGSGIGISISANRFPGIRAALCHDEYTARMSRMHNNANVLVMGGRTTGIETAKGMLDVWLNTDFEGGRHEKRLAKIEDYALTMWKKYFNIQ